MLLVNPACHRVGAARTDVLLDASLSMTDPGGDARWRAAIDSAQAAAGRSGRITAFGATPLPFAPAMHADAPVSLLLPALRDAAARGGRIVVVTDGMVDDAASLPDALLRGARIVVIPRADRPDAGIASLSIPAALRAGDTARARVNVIAAGTTAGDSVTLELLEQGRVAARTRIALGAGGSFERELSFVPAPAGTSAETRRFEARLSGLAKDAEPRDDVRRTASAVSQASAITLLSDAPDWDFRWLARTLTAGSGVPVHAYIRLGAAGWRDARTMRATPEATVRAEASAAALLVAHGTTDGVDAFSRLGRRAAWQWVTVPRQADASANGDWYVAAPEFASPVGGALSGVPPESLPPLDMVVEQRGDSVAWTGLVAQLDRRGRSRAVVQGAMQGNRRVVSLAVSGLWRWASHGGVAEEGYRALTASLTDWLLEERPGAPSLTALRDSLAQGAGEFLPRRPSLASKEGTAAASIITPDPIRFSPWLYVIALLALVGEWVLRRRKGLR